MNDKTARSCLACKHVAMGEYGPIGCHVTEDTRCTDAKLHAFEPKDTPIASDLVPPEEDHTPGVKYDQGKAKVGLMFKGFPRALLSIAEVTTYGAAKYTPLGFLEVPDAVNRYDDAKGRHMLEGYITEVDPESMLLHLQHEAWNALAKLELHLREKTNVN